MNAIRRHIVVVVVVLSISSLTIPVAAHTFDRSAPETVTMRLVEVAQRVLASIEALFGSEPMEPDTGPRTTERMTMGIDPNG